MEDLLHDGRLNGQSWWAYVSIKAVTITVALVAALFYWWRSEEAAPRVQRADVPGNVTEHKWKDIAKERPAGFPWTLRGCSSCKDVARHVWRLDDELCNQPLCEQELKEFFDELMKRLEDVVFLEAQPPIPGELADQ